MDWRKLLTRDQDTDWRDVSADLRSGATGTLHIRRVGMTVWWRVRDLVPGTGHAFYWPPTGLAAPVTDLVYPADAPSEAAPFYRDSLGRLCRSINHPPVAAGRWFEGSYVLPPGTAMPGDFGQEVA